MRRTARAGYGRAGARVYASGTEYVLPANGDNVIGFVTTAIARHEDTMLDIGRRYGVGYEEILAANPGMDPWLPGEGAEILIPTRFVLPNAPRDAIVVNLPEHRLYYYPPAKPGEPRVVRTYPISTAKMDWNTPLGVTRIVTKEKRPTGIRPHPCARSTRNVATSAAVVPPGPDDNLLGEHKMRLDIPGGATFTARIAGWRWHAGDPRLHTHVSGRRRRALRPGEHQYQVNHRSDDQGRLAAWNPVRRAAPLEGTNNPAHDDPAEMTWLLAKASGGA